MKRPFYEHGFWWWWNRDRNDWFVGCNPAIGVPKWWKPEWTLEARWYVVSRNH